MASSLNYVREAVASMSRLVPYMRPGRFLWLAVLGTSLSSSVLEGVGIGLLVPLLSLLLGDEQSTLMRPVRWLKEFIPGKSPVYYVLAFCCLVLAAIIAKNLVLYYSHYLATRLRRRISENLREAVFRRLQKTELHVYEQMTAGEYAHIFTTDVTRTMLAYDNFLLLVQRTSMAVFYVATMVVIAWRLTLLTLLLAGFVGGMVMMISKRLHRRGETQLQLYRALSIHLTESFGGVRVIRCANSQAREIDRFVGLNCDIGWSEQKGLLMSSMIAPLSEVVAVAGAMLIVGLAYYYLVRTSLMSKAQLMGFGFIVLRLLPLINQINGLQGNLALVLPSLGHVEKWLNLPVFPDPPFGRVEFAGLRDSIRFECVSFTYTTGKQVLRDIDLEIPRGKTVALVGASGSGKSTIAGLLLRLRRPASGRILVDGRDYWEFTAESWHHGLAVVEQEAFLFHNTLEWNIAYGCPEATPEAIMEAARIANLEETIRAMPNGLKTVVGERGTMLSGGQRQRLAIARAVIRKPNILVLDEATSALDNLSERQVQGALEAAQEGRTVLVIAHRLTTIRHADNIIVLADGQVIEQGPWQELMMLNGKFAELVSSVAPESNLAESDLSV